MRAADSYGALSRGKVVEIGANTGIHGVSLCHETRVCLQYATYIRCCAILEHMPDGPSEFNRFVAHRLIGARFEGHAIPVDVLSDIAVYKELVVAVASELFFKENPKRQRLPKNFVDGFALVLRNIEEGSAVAGLDRPRKAPRSGQQTMLLDSDSAGDVFERARDLVHDAIQSASGGNALPAAFPLTALSLFNGFGRHLKDDETIEISAPDGVAASYNRAVRKKLVLRQEHSYEDDIDVVGRIVRFDWERMSFELAVDDRRIPGKLDNVREGNLAVMRVAGAHGDKVAVRVAGVGAKDSQDTLVRIVRIDDVSYAEDEKIREQLDIKARLAVLAELATGWFDGDGAALDRRGLKWLSELLSSLDLDGMPRPYLYPNPDGRVRAEWTFLDAEVVADIDLGDHRVELLGVHARSLASREDSMVLDDDAAILRFVGFVDSFAPASGKQSG